MSNLKRPLESLFVGLSISESETADGHGFPPWQVNRVALQFSAALLGQGAGVVFGHDWRDDGVMEAVHTFARQMQPVDSAADRPPEPLLRNLLPWPDRPVLSREDREQLASTLRIETAGLPDGLSELADTPPSDRSYPYLRARGLTWLRRRLDASSNARVCLGGREIGFSGRYPGIVEEAAIAVERNTPLYLAGVLDGATRRLIDAVTGRPMRDDFCRGGRSASLYDGPPLGRESAADPDRRFDPAGAWDTFRRLGRDGLSALNGLTAEENDELFETPVIARAIQLVLRGLAHVRARST